MADEATTEAQQPTTDVAEQPETPAPAQEPAEPKAAKTDEIDWKAMARKHEAEAKKNRAAAAKLETIEAKQRTAEENATKAADDARAEAEAAKAELAVERAARKHGLTDDKDLDVLQGLPADKVDAVAKAIAAGKKQAGSGSSGREAGGGKGEPKPSTLTGVLGAHYSKQQ